MSSEGPQLLDYCETLKAYTRWVSDAHNGVHGTAWNKRYSYYLNKGSETKGEFVTCSRPNPKYCKTIGGKPLPFDLYNPCPSTFEQETFVVAKLLKDNGDRERLGPTFVLEFPTPLHNDAIIVLRSGYYNILTRADAESLGPTGLEYTQKCIISVEKINEGLRGEGDLSRFYKEMSQIWQCYGFQLQIIFQVLQEEKKKEEETALVPVPAAVAEPL